MNTQIAGSTRQQHVAQRLTLALAEVVERVTLQQVINGGIVEVGDGIALVSAFAAIDQLCQLTRRRIGKHITVGHMQSGLVGFDDDTRDDERRTTQLEEVVGSTHLVHLQDACKDIAESLFGIVGRGCIGRADSQLRLRQCLHVSLTVGSHRHLRELQIGSRHHVLRQALGDFRLQGIGGYLTVGCIVGTEVLPVVQFTNEDNHLLHALYLQHDILYLAQLDTQATQFNLVVGTS